MNRRDEHAKKMVAPIIITVIVILFLAAYGLIYFAIDELPIWVKLLVGLFAFSFAIGMIIVLIKRINEIKGGEEDDLDNY